MRKLIYMILLSVLLPAALCAQHLPERGEVRQGNRQYRKGNYEESIARYKKALEAAPGMFEPTYNLGNALYKAGRYDHAEQTMALAAADSTRSPIERAESFYNLGNARFKQQKYKEALESYKQSLRLNPADREAKYNYAYTKRLLDQQQNQQQNQQNQQNKDQQQQQQQQNQNQQDQQGQPDNKQGQPDKQQGQPDNGKDSEGGDGEQPVTQGLSEREQKQMLDAVQACEDRTQEKLKEKKKAKGVVRLKKNW